MGTKWTKEQQQAISLRNRNLLVSAAAGSGKTAVLAMRIISLLLDKEKGIDIDRLLVATFTDAAAAEMKERIRQVLESHLENDPDNEHLQKQSVLIYNANISTIHSFCLSVIRDHFHEIDLDPGFRIGEMGEIKLIRGDVMNELLEENYSSDDNKEFLDFVDKYGGGRNDKAIEAMIFKLFEYSMSTPRPEKWLEQCLENYKISFGDNIEDTSYYEIVDRQFNYYINDAISYIQQGLDISTQADGPYIYIPMLESDLQTLKQMKELTTFEERRKAIKGYSPMRLSAKKDEGISPIKRDAVKELRRTVKDKIISKLEKEFFFLSEDELILDMINCQKSAETLVKLTLDFSEKFTNKKLSKNILDFSDMEHYALKILTTIEDHQLIPSAVAKEYQNKFEEVMVDEYQDINYVQEAIIKCVSRSFNDGHNVFMVGDIKQSIYRFRLSVPELFMEKYNSYTDEDSKNQRIILHKNFRSRKEILTSTNYIFSGLMQKEIGGIEYDHNAALYLGADYKDIDDEENHSIKMEMCNEIEPKTSCFSYSFDLMLCSDFENSEYVAIASSIKRLIREGRVTDKVTGKLRKVQYGDITILLRTLKGVGENLATFLMDEGIPVYYGSQVGYFDAYEVRVLLDYLRIISNQRQDIPLTAVLTSPFVGLSAKELATIKKAFPDVPFYEGVREYAKLVSYKSLCASCKSNGSSSDSCKCNGHIDNEISIDNIWADYDLANKLNVFWQGVERYRNKLPYIGIHDLLWSIVEDSGYGLYIQGMPGGNQRKANVDMLIEKAVVFETTSYKGLFHFIRYIEELKKQDVEIGEASIVDEQSDVVRIMSIHKSKGLEFPVVILAGMSKMFNTSDLRDAMLIHPTLGIGLNAIDLKRRTTAPTILKNVIKNQLQMDNTGEQLRVLYVALTRAKEKLIMIGKISEKKIAELQENQDYVMDKPLIWDILSANSYTDWVLPMILKRPAHVPIELNIFLQDEMVVEQSLDTIEESLGKEILVNWDNTQIFDQDLREQFLTQLNYVYPHRDKWGIKLKFTVSELKKRASLGDEGQDISEVGEALVKEPDVIPLIPGFLQGQQEVSGAQRGNAYHIFMEHVDFTKTYDLQAINELKKELFDSKKMDKEILDSVDGKDILNFLETDLAFRMKRAVQSDSLFEEQPFVMKVDASIVYPIELGNETILVQGIVDIWFQEEGEIVVLDYKTDNVKSSKELVDRYRTQLDFYAMALEKLTGRAVKEKLIYSFKLGEVVEVK